MSRSALFLNRDELPTGVALVLLGLLLTERFHAPLLSDVWSRQIVVQPENARRRS